LGIDEVVSKPIRAALLGGVLAVLVLDTGASLASLVIGFSYASLAPITYLIYATIGFLAARTTTLWAGVFASATVAAFDATVGWGISWVIGPGRPPEELQHPSMVIAAAVMVVLLGAVLGLVGGGLARLVARPPAA
jgi:hypothetical protein